MRSAADKLDVGCPEPAAVEHRTLSTRSCAASSRSRANCSGVRCGTRSRVDVTGSDAMAGFRDTLDPGAFRVPNRYLKLARERWGSAAGEFEFQNDSKWNLTTNAASRRDVEEVPDPSLELKVERRTITRSVPCGYVKPKVERERALALMSSDRRSSRSVGEGLDALHSTLSRPLRSARNAMAACAMPSSSTRRRAGD